MKSILLPPTRVSDRILILKNGDIAKDIEPGKMNNVIGTLRQYY